MRKFIALFAAICLLSSATTIAVQTSYWTHTSADDFKQGTLDRVVATSHGELRLARKVDFLLGDDPRISAIYALAETPDGTLYAGTGPQGVLLSLKGGKLETAATLGRHSAIFCLTTDPQGRLLIGTGGEKGRVLRIDKPGEAPGELLASPDVQYVWSIAATPDGMIYAATGPNGQIHQIAPDGKLSVLFSSTENNILSMISDGKDSLYCGTDPNGLIYRINRKTGEAFVLYDCDESEVSALAFDVHGNLYAGTSQAGSEAGMEPPAPSGAGRPETGPKPSPLPSDPPVAPAPPERPEPNPNDPELPRSNTRPGQASSRTQESVRLVAQPEMPDDSPLGPATEPALPVPHEPDVPHRALGEAPEGGNAIYRITPDGFVSEIFRAPVVIYSILPDNGSLLVATGGDGQVFQIDVASEEASVIADTDSAEALALLRGKDGRIYLGLANVGNLATLSKGFAQTGSFVSPVLDATQASRFGKMQLRGTMPGGTKLTVATRSGNVRDPDHPGWSKWSDEAPASEFVSITSPSARFLQYRLTFGSNDGSASPSVGEVTIAYQVPNVSPRIASISISSTGASRTPPATDTLTTGSAPHQTQTISWEASDPNGDSLIFSLSFRPSGATEWILLKENLTEPAYEWNTRAVADGRYEIRVVASDERANPPGQGKSASRLSESVIVDNTPPVIGDVKVAPEPQKVRISCRIVDRTTTVARLEYAVNSAEVWQTVLPVDTISDSPEEAYDFVIPVKSSGAAQITLRATDERGNVSYETLRLTIPESR
jgi:hypothetical protein